MVRSRPGAKNAPDPEGGQPSTTDEERRAFPLLIKHLARSLNRGQLITCTINATERLTGYPAGHDEASIFLLIPTTGPGSDEHTFTRKIVKRAHVTSVDLHDESTFAQEPCRAEMEKILSGYRSHMVATVLGRRYSGGTS